MLLRSFGSFVRGKRVRGMCAWLSPLMRAAGFVATSEGPKVKEVTIGSDLHTKSIGEFLAKYQFCLGLWRCVNSSLFQLLPWLPRRSKAGV